MPETPQRQEIDHRTIKLIVGLIAVTLAGLTGLFAGFSITSISASYYVGGWSQTIFIGFLFAISALLLAYNGTTKWEMILAKITADVPCFPAPAARTSRSCPSCTAPPPR